MQKQLSLNKNMFWLCEQLHDLVTYYVIVKKGDNPGVYLQIYTYVSSSLSLNTKTWYHSP